MKLIENMTVAELESEAARQEASICSARAELDKIHGRTDYSDELAKYFHLGKVGFRTDTKRQSRTLERAIDNGVKACDFYEKISGAEGRLKTLRAAIRFISENAPAEEKETATCRSLEETTKKTAINLARPLEWKKVKGYYGLAYSHGDFVIERIDNDLVAIRDGEGTLLTHRKTVTEAKAWVSLRIDNTPIN